MKKIYTIGRDEGCDIVIPDNTDVISRLHATIRIEANDKIFLTDQSRNGTYVNGMKMSSNVEVPISRKDVVSFAHIHNLDWSLVPKQKNNKLKIFFITTLILVIIGIVCYFILGAKKQVLSDPPKPTSVESVTPNDTTVKDTVTEEPKEPVQEKPKDKEVAKEAKTSEKSETPKEKQDSITVEKTKEEIYNPIY